LSLSVLADIMDNMDRKEYLQRINNVIENGKFKDNWDSLRNIEIPQWYKNAKFGIFIHWGIYSVPAFSNEWYSRNMYVKDSAEYKHHISTYGSHKDFGYKDFIPMFKGEKFNAEEWLDLFEAAGAKYIMPVAEHHDGFQMYKSNISKWNSYEMGPKRDVVGELKLAAEKKNIRLCVSSHRIEHWFFMSHGKEFDSDIKEPLTSDDFYWAAMPDSDFQNLYPDPAPSEEYMEDWLIRCCELVDNYQPAVVYFDWWVHIAKLKPYLKKFAAYYYNKMDEPGKMGVINYKHDAFMYGCAVLDIERGQFSSIQPNFWQTCTSVANNSWGYTKNNQYRQTPDILRNLVDVVSKNGCMLLNVGPKPDGTIPDDDRKILLEIGEWLKINGEAIYSTSYFRIFGEGPTVINEGQFTDTTPKDFTCEDIRFTQNGSILYAIVLVYPDDGVVNIKTLASRAQNFHGIIKNISILGFDEKPEYERDNEKLTIRTRTIRSLYPVVFKIEID